MMDDLEDRIKKLEDQLEMLRLDMELVNRKTLKDIRRLNCSISMHRELLQDLKPVYEDYRSRKVEAKVECERSYG